MAISCGLAIDCFAKFILSFVEGLAMTELLISQWLLMNEHHDSYFLT